VAAGLIRCEPNRVKQRPKAFSRLRGGLPLVGDPAVLNNLPCPLIAWRGYAQSSKTRVPGDHAEKLCRVYWYIKTEQDASTIIKENTLHTALRVLGTIFEGYNAYKVMDMTANPGLSVPQNTYCTRL